MKGTTGNCLAQICERNGYEREGMGRNSYKAARLRMVDVPCYGYPRTVTSIKHHDTKTASQVFCIGDVAISGFCS